MIDVVQSLRADVDAWILGKPLPGESLPKVNAGGRPHFVDADRALAHLRRMVERGLSDKLHTPDDLKFWVPGENDKAKIAKPKTDGG